MSAASCSNWALPSSPVLTIKATPHSGRAVFAEADLFCDTHVLATTPPLSPIAYVILRPYRREVCAWCFSYDRGREWKIRNAAAGTAFCSARCQSTWSADNDEICVTALETVEAAVKALVKRQYGGYLFNESNPIAINNHAGDIDHISQMWRGAEIVAKKLLVARQSGKMTKSERAELRNAQELSPDPGILSYVLSGILTIYKARKAYMDAEHGNILSNIDCATLLPSLFELASDDRVFVANPMTPSPLHDYTSAYLVLMATLPVDMLSLTTTTLIINLASRASHNAFSIRPEGTTDGDQSGEFLGWGVWPEASFFNHSCRPNLRKERNGRIWSFAVDSVRDGMIRQGQQMSITYLGGDERELNFDERQKRLREQWGFGCRCERCQEETQNQSVSIVQD